MKRKSTTTDGLKEPLIMPDDNDKERSYSEVKANNRKRKFKICCCLSLSVAVIIFSSLVVVSAILLHKFLLIDTRTSVVQVGGNVPVLLDDGGFNTYDISTVEVTLATETNSSAIIHIGQCIQPTTAILPLRQVTVFSNSSSHQAINYFSKQRPLYLLNGSVLIYNITAAETQALTDPECAGFVYLFDNYTAYLAFLSDDDNAIMNYYKSKCISSDLETWTVFEFNIEETTFIYAGIELNSNNYTIEADISVNLVRYNTSDFKAYNLSYNDTKTVHDCHQLDCLLSYKQCLFVTSPQTADVTIKYHRQNQIYKVIAFVGFSFAGLFMLVVVVLAAVIVKIIRRSNDQNYSRLASNSRSAEDDTENSPPVVRSNVESVNFSEFSSNSAHCHETTDSSVSLSDYSDTNSSRQLLASPQNSTSQPLAVVQSNSVNSSEFSSSAHDSETTGQVHSLAVSNDDDHDTRQLDSQNHGNSSDLDLHATSRPIVIIERPRDDCYEDYIVINSYTCSSGYGSESDEQDLHQLLENSSILSDQVVTLPQSQESPINFDLSYPLDDILSKAKSVFGGKVMTKLILNSSGLIHHCSQYGVTLIIPEGAVQRSATVWFGASLFSDKFKFEGDYVPVSPIVWVYIDQVLLKPLELHIPHHIDLSKMSEIAIKEQLFLLTAVDDNSRFSIFQKNPEFQVDIELNSQIAKIFSTHLCSNCIATHNRYYETIPKRYLLVRAEKNEPKEKVVEFIFLYQQQGCKKMVESQSANTGFTLIKKSFAPVTFANSSVHLSFDPTEIKGWIRTYADFQKDSLSEEDIDYFKVMGCTGGEVTEEQLKNLELLEEICSYPPRFTIQFTADDSTCTTDTPDLVKIKFHGIIPSESTIILKRPGHLDMTPLSVSPNNMHVKEFSDATDPVLGDMLKIITADDFLKDKWYSFGYKLGLTTGLLNEIEKVSNSESIQCTKMVLLHWRAKNKEKTWEPIARALAIVGLSSLAHELRDQFGLRMDQLTGSVYCSLCDKCHRSVTEVPSTVLNAAPSIAELNNLVGAKIEDKYHLFGVAVGLEEGYLSGLRIDFHNCQERFNQVFNKWQQTHPESFAWGTVIRVLQSNTFKANELAEQVIEYLISVSE